MRNLRLLLSKHFRNTVYSNVWIAVGSGLATIQTCLLFDLPWWPTTVFVAVSTFATYNFQRLIKLNRKPEFYTPGRNQWIFRNRRLIGFLCGISIISCIGLFFLFRFRDVFFLAIPMLVSLLYVQPITKVKNLLPDLRAVPGMKVIWVGLIWMWATVLFPVFHHAQPLNQPDVMIWSGTQMLFIIGITIPFDIRDLNFDPVSYKTIPQLFGIKGAKVVASVLVGSTILGWAYLYTNNNIGLIGFVSQIIVVAITMVVIRNTKPQQPELYFTGLIDGLIILSGILLILTESYI